MGSTFYRYRFDATGGATFTEGSSTGVDIASTSMEQVILHYSAGQFENPPAITSISSVSIAVQGATGADSLFFDFGALGAAGFQFTFGPDTSGQILAFQPVTIHLDSGDITVPMLLPFANWSGGENGQPLSISLVAPAAEQDVRYGESVSPQESTPQSLILLASMLDHVDFLTTSNAPPASVVISYSFGGSYAYGTPTVTVNINQINDQPVITNGNTASLGSVDQHAANAFQVSTFRQSFSDTDGPGAGIAITAASTNNGHWEYSTDGSSWTAVGTVGSNASLLLRDTDWVRFVGDGSVPLNQTVNDTITYRIWDQFSGSAGTKVDTSSLNSHSPYSSGTDTASLTVSGLNAAPVIISAAATVPAITEDDVGNAGQTVASFAGAGITDADTSALKGIAITAHLDGNGHWEYSTDARAHWAPLGTVSDSSALLLRGTDYIRFVPDAKNGTSASFTYHAWDQTDGGQAGGTGDTTHNGGITAYSTGAATASIAVSDVPDVATITVTPVVTTETKLPSFVFFNIANKVSVVDLDLADQGHATNYIAGSGSITQIDGPTPPSDTLADLLTLDSASGNILYDRSAFSWLSAGESVVYTITFQAQSNHDTPQTTTLTVTIDGLNDSPVLSAPNHQTFAAMTEDDPPSAAHKVIDFRGSITDNDPGALTGVAITATAGNGDWQYSTDNGATWNGFVATDASALLLRDDDLVRFAPDGKNGGPASFTYHAWDQTSGSAGDSVDATVTGSGTAFSRASDSVTLAVASINDAPVVVPDHMTLLPITEDDVANTGQPVWTFLCNAISDVDNGAVQGIALTGLTIGNGHWEYSLDGGSSWATVGSVGEGAALLLKADDFMRFVPDEKNGTSATLTYHAWDQTSGTHGQSIDLTVAGATGGTTAYSTVTDTVSIAVSDVNDPPVVSGPVTLAAIAEDSGARLITQVELLAHASDVDTVHTLTAADLQISPGNGQLVDNLNGTWTYTPAPDDDTSVSFSFNVTDGIAPPVATAASLDITPVNDAPVAQSGTAQGNEDTPITGTVTATDVDTPVNTLTYALVGQNGGALHGSVTLDAATGAYVYTPNHDFFGTDSFSFTANDGALDSAAASVSVTVDPVNDPPVITTATPLATPENQTFVTALGSSDVDGPNAATFTITGGADSGLFDIVGGNLVFRTARDYETQAHSYQVQISAFDGVDTVAKLLTVNLTDVNDNAPVFSSNANAPDIVPENTATQTVVYGAAANDADTTAPANSVAYSLSGDDAALFTVDPVSGKVHFLASPDFEAPKDHNHDNNYQLTVHANDGVHDVTQDVTVTVTNINEAPVATQGAASGEQTITGQLPATDIDSPSLTYSLVSGTAHGALTVHTDGTFSYTAALGFRGTDSFSFKANDGALDSNVATFDLNVTQLHFTGSAGNDNYAVNGNQRVEAGTGTDTFSFNFKLTDATVSFVGNQVIVDAPGSHTVLTGFEIYQFTDGTVDNTKGNPLIDKLYYYSQYHDVWNAHADADQHFMQTGWKEGRNPDAFFDTKAYLATYADVAAAGVNPLTHYDQSGWKEGRDPSINFDTKNYLSHYPDVAAAHVDPLAHFLQSGLQEGRSAFADGHFG
jgi:VCBS repeat-containing protein